MKKHTLDETRLAVEENQSRREADELLLERLKVDHEFVSRLLLERDIGAAVRAAGFSPTPKMLGYVESSIKKIRTYITDQVHALETKKEQIHSSVVVVNSGNSAVDW